MPTVRELMEQYDIASPNGILCHVRVLQLKGYLGKAPPSSAGPSRSYRILRRPDGAPFDGFAEKD
jgi:hypothetical protein